MFSSIWRFALFLKFEIGASYIKQNVLTGNWQHRT